MKISILAASLALTAGAMPAGAQTISASDLQQRLAGKRLTLSCLDGTSGSGRYAHGGSMGTLRGTYRVAGGPAMQDTGRVRRSGEQLCIALPMMTGGQERCFSVVQRSATRFQFTTYGVSVCDITTG